MVGVDGVEVGWTAVHTRYWFSHDDMLVNTVPVCHESAVMMVRKSAGVVLIVMAVEWDVRGALAEDRPLNDHHYLGD